MPATLTKFNRQVVLYVQDYGAKFDGVTADDTAFADCIADLPSVGGVIEMPTGTTLLSSTLDMAIASKSIWLRGQGRSSTLIKTSVTDAAGINAASNLSRFQQLSDFSLWQSAAVLPTVQRSGNYGIRVTNGVSFHLKVKKVEVRYFGDSAIFLVGPNAPISISEPYLYYNAGYGVETGISPDTVEDLEVRGGSIFNCWGGVKLNRCAQGLVNKVDIELGTDGKYPALYITNQSHGCVCIGSSLSTGASGTTPAGQVVIDCEGNTIIGGGNDASVSGIDNVLLSGALANQNTIKGGIYVGKATGTNYPVTVSGGIDNIIEGLLCSGYATGYDKVNDADGNNTIAIGMKNSRSAGITGVSAARADFDTVAADVLSLSTMGRGSFTWGAYYLWIDAAGKLRIKSSVPTSDTDGTIVGTQS